MQGNKDLPFASTLFKKKEPINISKSANNLLSIKAQANADQPDVHLNESHSRVGLN
jgi:hypothetical protein